jgi:hypothetical protein
MFIIRFDSSAYLTNIQMTSSYLTYDLTNKRERAQPLNDFDSRLVLKRLRNAGHTKATREEVPQEA